MGALQKQMAEVLASLMAISLHVTKIKKRGRPYAVPVCIEKAKEMDGSSCRCSTAASAESLRRKFGESPQILKGAPRISTGDKWLSAAYYFYISFR